MMNYRTKVHLDPAEFQITHEDSLLLLGSCFSDHIGQLFESHLFDTVHNPFYTIYNPISLYNVISHSEEQDFVPELVIQRDGLYFHYDYHSKIFGHTSSELQQKIHEKNKILIEAIQQSTVVFITLGTSIVYNLQSLDHHVSNCHRQASNIFKKTQLNFDQVTTTLYLLIDKIRTLSTKNPRIVFTLSPVRHIKDGLEQNSISKAILRTAIHEVNSAGHSGYFPSYEIVIDDLRDYRYYKKDLIHPDESAIEYIWKHLEQHYMNTKTQDVNAMIDKITKNLQHRPLSIQSDLYKKHLNKTGEQLDELQRRNPELNTEKLQHILKKLYQN